MSNVQYRISISELLNWTFLVGHSCPTTVHPERAHIAGTGGADVEGVSKPRRPSASVSESGSQSQFGAVFYGKARIPTEGKKPITAGRISQRMAIWQLLWWRSTPARETRAVPGRALPVHRSKASRFTNPQPAILSKGVGSPLHLLLIPGFADIQQHALEAQRLACFADLPSVQDQLM
jgi:hypothetical protein